MKIREIIAEDSNVDEALGTAWNLAKAAGRELIGKGAQAAAKSPGVMGQGPKWAQTINNFSDRIAAKKAGAVSSTLATARAGFTVSSGIMSALKAWQVLDPLLVYQRHMSKYADALAQGSISEQQYEMIREKELTQLVGQWAMMLGTNMVLRGGVMPLLGGFKLFGLTTIYSFVNTLTKGAQWYLMKWWNSEEGRKWIASVLALGVVGDEDWASAIIGGNLASFLDKLKGKTRQAPANAPADKAATGQGNQGAQPADATPADAEQPAPASSQKTNPQDYEYYSDTLVKNKKTGKLELKDF